MGVVVVVVFVSVVAAPFEAARGCSRGCARRRRRGLRLMKGRGRSTSGVLIAGGESVGGGCECTMCRLWRRTLCAGVSGMEGWRLEEDMGGDSLPFSKQIPFDGQVQWQTRVMDDLTETDLPAANRSAYGPTSTGPRQYTHRYG